MTLYFFQNCISPHQIPYIQECAKDKRIDSVYLIVPRTDYDMRKDMGWDSSSLLNGTNIKYLLRPNDEQVHQLLNVANSDLFCFFSGIRADKDVFHWFKLSLSYDLKRYIITEPPYIYNKPLWLHYIRFFVQGYKFVKSINGIFAIGQLAVDYYKNISKKWKVFPFQYVTAYHKRTDNLNLTGKFKLLFVGSLCKRKNVKVVINSLIGLQDIEFSIVGNGKEEESLKQLALKKNLSVEFLGKKPMVEIPHLMENYDALILPSLHDGWGGVVNEAMTLGLYVIVSENCGSKELIRDKMQGVIFKNNQNSLHLILKDCIEKKKLIRSNLNYRLQLSQNIQAPVVSDYFIKCLNKENDTLSI